jgi:hypothetical protein
MICAPACFYGTDLSGRGGYSGYDTRSEMGCCSRCRREFGKYLNQDVLYIEG